MKKSILIYALALAGLVFLLKFVQYSFIMRDLSIEIYISIIALFFTILGIWAGLRLTGQKRPDESKTSDEMTQTGQKHPREDIITKLGISRREYEVLVLMSGGLSNQEIADHLYVSLNTVKTHAANLYIKMDVSRRTQAISKGREWGILN